MGGHAPPLGPLLERARTEGDDPAPPQRPAHAAALARSLRDAALARDWPRAAALASLGLLAQPPRSDKQSVYSFSHNVAAMLPLAQLSVEVAQTHPDTFSAEDELALRREARRRALARDDMAAAEGEMMQTVALLVVRGGDTARAAAELLRRPPRRRGASSTGAASARARLAALLAYSQWAALAEPRPVQPPGSAESSCFDAPYFPAAVARTAKALRNAALPLAREAFAATPTDPVLAGALMALQTAGKGANAARRALRTAAKLARAAPDDPEAWRLYRLMLPACATRGGFAAESSGGGDAALDAALRRAASAELRADPASESALAELLALRSRRSCSAAAALAAAAAHAEVCPACPVAWAYLASTLGAPPRRNAARRVAKAWPPERAAMWRRRYFTAPAHRHSDIGPVGASARTLRDVAVVAGHLRAVGVGGGAFGRAVAQRLAVAGHAALVEDVRSAHRLPPQPPAVGETATAWDIPEPAADAPPQPVDAAAPAEAPAVPAEAAVGEEEEEAEEEEARPVVDPDDPKAGVCDTCAHTRKDRAVCRLRRRHTAPMHVVAKCRVCGPAAERASTLPPGRCAHCAHCSATARICRLVLRHEAPEHVKAACDKCAAKKDKQDAKKRGAADAALPDEAPAAKKARAAKA